MDMDYVEERVTRPAFQSARKAFVPVDERHPFDVDGYISNYSSRTAVDRLIHIISICPSIAPEAFQLAVQHIHQSRDPSLYQPLFATYDQLAAQAELHLPPSNSLPTLDSSWVEETMSKNQTERQKLEVELKTYTNNMIKESIRMAHRDLGEYYRSVGEFSTAIKHFTKSREFCTTGQHVLEMCISMLEIFIEQKNYAHITTYVFKADAALDAATTVNAGSSSGAAASKKSQSEEREKVQGKLDLANALSFLGASNFEKAAYHFLRIGSPSNLGDWLGKLVSPGDIAIFGTLCALASYSRNALKAQLLENSSFGIYIESEPYVRELIDAYMNSNFKSTLELLTKYSTRHQVDIHLSSHVNELTNLIRNTAVVLYFKPFSSIKLDRMSAAFGWTLAETERQVVTLIQQGQIQGRVDSQNKILLAKKTDYRADLFARAIKAGSDIQASNRKLLLRMRLHQADLVIKHSKSGQHMMSDILQD